MSNRSKRFPANFTSSLGTGPRSRKRGVALITDSNAVQVTLKPAPARKVLPLDKYGAVRRRPQKKTVIATNLNDSEAAYMAALNKPVGVMHGSRPDAAAVKYALKIEANHINTELNERILYHMKKQAHSLQQEDEDSSL